jgi:hypothetical protein
LLLLVLGILKGSLISSSTHNFYIIRELPLTCSKHRGLLRFIFIPRLTPLKTTRAVLCDWVGRAGIHTGFRTITSSVYQIFTKLGHMIPPWKGKNPIYFGVIRSKVKVTITINRIFDNRVVSAR